MVTGEKPEMLGAVGVSFGFALVLGLCFMFLGPTVGLIAILPVVILFGAILSMMYGASLKRATIASGAFLAYKVAIGFVWAAMLS
jgi:hypothetical protein